MCKSKMSVFYTDGSCIPNPGAGGWAFIRLANKDSICEWHIAGGERMSTNNRMELTAVIEALQFSRTIENTIYSDSTYVINGIKKWIKSWERRNWINVKNVDLWKMLIGLTKGKKIRWNHVKAHSGDKYNELVDTLAKNKAKQNK